jgi:hypothetical protein
MQLPVGKLAVTRPFRIVRGAIVQCPAPVSLAGLTMRGDLDMSAAAFGFATGAFFWGYFIFEVPSNVILEKVGARLRIARI